ncbi:MAG: MerR family DNA-binding protein [bacterium JZ-2024 1]
MRTEREKVDGEERLWKKPKGDGESGGRIDHVTQALGITSRTIRFYEKMGYLPVLPRTPSGYRILPPDVLPRLKFILRARSLGFNLREIREILEVADQDKAVCPTTLEVIRKKRALLKEKIQQLRELDRELEKMEDLCQQSRKRGDEICPAIMGDDPGKSPENKKRTQRGEKK